jgi:hypothetical protein
MVGLNHEPTFFQIKCCEFKLIAFSLLPCHTVGRTATAPGSNSDLYIEFTPGNYSIEYYENNSINPTRVKNIVF